VTKAFVSYSWDAPEHKEWVRTLAARLRGDGVDVTLDQWHVVPGDQLPKFMEEQVRESDYVLIVCTPRYKARSDGRQGGVGYEGDIMTAEVLTTRNQRKFIPLLRAADWTDAAPSWLSGKYYLDFTGDPYSEHSYEDLISTISGTRPKAPPIGKPTKKIRNSAPRQSVDATDNPAQSDEIRIVGVIVDEVGTPRGDGTRGSALYRVPFQLSRRPPSDWSELFVHYWDRPPSFTTMHRPGIASVQGDQVILDGTTIEEVQKFHRDTLILACNEANKAYADLLARRAAEEERELKKLEHHRRTVEDIADKIHFDDKDEKDA
jgi:hypothetical protein